MRSESPLFEPLHSSEDETQIKQEQDYYSPDPNNPTYEEDSIIQDTIITKIEPLGNQQTGNASLTPPATSVELITPLRGLDSTSAEQVNADQAFYHPVGERIYYRDARFIKREVWMPGDGHGHELSEILGLAVTTPWRFFQSHIGTITDKDQIPRFVILDDQAAYDILVSKTYSQKDLSRFWSQDFTHKGVLRNDRPNRGRPAIRRDDHDPQLVLAYPSKRKGTQTRPENIPENVIECLTGEPAGWIPRIFFSSDIAQPASTGDCAIDPEILDTITEDVVRQDSVDIISTMTTTESYDQNAMIQSPVIESRSLQPSLSRKRDRDDSDFNDHGSSSPTKVPANNGSSYPQEVLNTMIHPGSYLSIANNFEKRRKLLYIDGDTIETSPNGEDTSILEYKRYQTVITGQYKELCAHVKTLTRELSRIKGRVQILEDQFGQKGLDGYDNYRSSSE